MQDTAPPDLEIRPEVHVHKVAPLFDVSSESLLTRLRLAGIPVLGTGRGTTVYLDDLRHFQREREREALSRLAKSNGSVRHE